MPGEDLGRLLSLTDGVFAFALTLLVLSLTVPSIVGASNLPEPVLSGRLGAALQRDSYAFIGYVFTFVMIAIWWVSHHRLFQFIVRYDEVLLGLNLALLLEIAVMPFVLKVFVSYSGTQVAVILFSLIQASTGLTLGLIWRYASWHRRLLRPDFPDAAIRYYLSRAFLTPVVFLISIGVSFVNLTASEIVWLGVFVAQRYVSRAYATHASSEDPVPPSS